jgi:spore germination cell wall hydrolase CwlJ-like protein
MLSAKILLVYLLQSLNTTGIGIDTSKIDVEQTYCLAKNIYFEAGGEDIQGQFAVAAVTLNRAKDPRYPRTICEVVKQKTSYYGRLVCQFSWYCMSGKEVPVRNKDGSVNQAVVDKFQIAVMVAIKTLYGNAPDITRGATHFHNPNIVVPAWATKSRRTLRLGNHDFYRL